jgi:hypothetical protein
VISPHIIVGKNKRALFNFVVFSISQTCLAIKGRGCISYMRTECPWKRRVLKIKLAYALQYNDATLSTLYLPLKLSSAMMCVWICTMYNERRDEILKKVEKIHHDIFIKHWCEVYWSEFKGWGCIQWCNACLGYNKTIEFNIRKSILHRFLQSLLCPSTYQWQLCPRFV